MQEQQFGWGNLHPSVTVEGVIAEVEVGTFVDTLKALLHSRKVLLAMAGVAQTLVAHYFDIPAEVWASIDGLLVVVIGAIAHEDAAEKRGPS
jgi:hypothetical protein